MVKKDPRVVAYIEMSAGFARPILKHLRKLVHKADPDIEETLKWGMPTFMHDGIVCGMAAFKQHCALGFWKSKLILDRAGRRVDESMGHFGRISALKDLPADKQLIGYIRKAVKLNQQGVRVPGREKKPAKPLAVPSYFRVALKSNKKALAAFEAFSPSHRNEYIQWVTEAKQQPTRDKRLATAVEWLAKGRSRNWKYEKRK